MNQVDLQFGSLLEKHPSALKAPLASGAVLITVPNFEIPGGWTKPEVLLRFLVPTGYPFSKPDCFWVDPDLRLQTTGQMPQNTNHSPIPENGPEALLWFSWHTATWNPNRDSLVTYVNVIRNRFMDLR